ncbi:hypothetical protein ABZ379_14340 [Streptomyces canus]|uniref:hypothetical protein n=1 Tax=Streptomyces TaxID=1883 RepID=UPI0033B64B13
MKSLKAAAVVAGSLVLAGAAAPAFAQDTADLTPTSLNGAVNSLTKGPLDVRPLQHQSDALNTENKKSVLHTAKKATAKANSRRGLLGGLPVGK